MAQAPFYSKSGACSDLSQQSAENLTLPDGRFYILV